MRTWTLVATLLISPAAFAAGDQISCMESCSNKTQACMSGCKDDKCGQRCVARIEQCAKTCEGKNINPKHMDAAKKDAAAGNSKIKDKDR